MKQLIKISQVKSNPNNPRLIKNDKFKKLVKSVQDFPEMLELRPIVVDENMIVLGGNMRLKACKEAGLKEVWIEVADLTEQQKKEFTIKDNVGFGEWEWDMLANDWEQTELEDWGLDIPSFETDEEKYFNEQDLFNIEIPFYIPSEIKPQINELANLNKTKVLIKKIELLQIDNDLKEILKIRASFFTDFNFQKIADYFYKENKEVQEVFKDLGMVILAPKEAVERGFINLKENISEL
jgi:hypothetical protein